MSPAVCDRGDRVRSETRRRMCDDVRVDAEQREDLNSERLRASVMGVFFFFFLNGGSCLRTAASECNTG